MWMHRRLVSLSLVCNFAVVSGWAPQLPSAHQISHSVITMSASAGAGDENGSLLVSNMHRIGLASDASSKLKLMLASQSPRRREILDMMGLAGRYTAEPSPLNEEELQIELAKKDTKPTDYARTLAERKAQAMGVTLRGEGAVTLVIGSDTIVDLDGRIMEKPKDEADAIKTINRLSGNWHQVHTGVAVYGHDGEKQKLLFSYTETANVKFATLSDEDVKSYVATTEPMDKAGSYGIQGIGGQLVERLEGDFFAVMGLPMHSLSRELSRAISELGDL